MYLQCRTCTDLRVCLSQALAPTHFMARRQCLVHTYEVSTRHKVYLGKSMNNEYTCTQDGNKFSCYCYHDLRSGLRSLYIFSRTLEGLIAGYSYQLSYLYLPLSQKCQQGLRRIGSYYSSIYLTSALEACSGVEDQLNSLLNCF